MDRLRLCFVPIVVAAASFAGADQSIYSTKLDNGWQIWGWAKIEQKGPTITVTAKDWEAIYLHHDPQSASDFKSFTFQIGGGAKGGQRIQVRAVANKKPLKEVYLKTLEPGKWTTASVPLKNLSIPGKFEGLWIQAQKPCTFQLRAIALKK